MTEPKKSLRIGMFIGLLALNIFLLALVLQRNLPPLTLPERIAPQAKNPNPTAQVAALDHSVYMPLVASPYEAPLVLLPGDGVYYERDQDLQIVHVLGEVLNNTPTTINTVMIEAVLNLKKGGQTTLRGSPLVGSLAPGAQACFDLYVVEAKEVESYAIKILSYATGGSVPGGVEFVVTNHGYDAHNFWYSLEGTVNSADPMMMNDLRAVATLYDSSGRILGCEQSYVRTQSEEANTPATFSILFINRDFSQGSNFSLAISGNPQ